VTGIRRFLRHIERVSKEWLSRWWRPRPGLQRGDPLPDDDHILRYIGKKHVHEGIVNGSGFLSRPQESAPSVNWLEYFPPPLENQVAQVAAVKRIKYEKKGKLVRINVGQTKAYVAANATDPIELFFAYDPLLVDIVKGYQADPSHAEIRGVPVENTPEGELVKDLLADCIIDSPSFSPDR
jgi:hypothetical protein